MYFKEEIVATRCRSAPPRLLAQAPGSAANSCGHALLPVPPVRAPAFGSVAKLRVAAVRGKSAPPGLLAPALGSAATPRGRNAPPVRAPPPVPLSDHRWRSAGSSRALPVFFALSGQSVRDEATTSPLVLGVHFSHRVADVEQALRHLLRCRAQVVFPRTASPRELLLLHCAAHGVWELGIVVGSES